MGTLIALIVAVSATLSVILLIVSRRRIDWQRPHGPVEFAIDYLERRRIRVAKAGLIARFSDLRLPPRMPSQHGEEILLWNFFQRQHGFFVEVGAHDGVTGSNTYFLESIGWTGILIEPDPELCAECAGNRPHSRVIQSAAGDGSSKEIAFFQVRGTGEVDALSFTKPDPAHEERVRRAGGRIRRLTVPAVALAGIIGSGEVDFLSIDVEGAEIDVLDGIDFDHVSPAVIVVEINDERDRPAIISRLERAGYEERRGLSVNRFFAKCDDPRSFG